MTKKIVTNRKNMFILLELLRLFARQVFRNSLIITVGIIETRNVPAISIYIDNLTPVIK